MQSPIPMAKRLSLFFAVEMVTLHCLIEMNLEESLQKWQEAPESRVQSNSISLSAEGKVTACASSAEKSENSHLLVLYASIDLAA